MVGVSIVVASVVRGAPSAAGSGVSKTASVGRVENCSRDGGNLARPADSMLSAVLCNTVLVFREVRMAPFGAAFLGVVYPLQCWRRRNTVVDLSMVTTMAAIGSEGKLVCRMEDLRDVCFEIVELNATIIVKSESKENRKCHDKMKWTGGSPWWRYYFLTLLWHGVTTSFLDSFS